jgi:aminotransferase
LEQLAELAMEKDLLVISDEVYKHILFDDQNYTSISSFDGMKQRTVIIDSLSKTYAMTGWRIGYAASTKVIINSITKLQENVSACVTMPSQYAAIEAMSGPQEHLEYMVSQYKERRDYMLKRIKEIPNISCQKPKGTFYAFISIKDTGLTSEEFAMNLLDKNQVVVVPGTAFGQFGEGYIRMSYATSMKNIKEGLNRIEDFVMNECCV